MTANGYQAKLLRIDLTSQTASEEPVSDETIRRYIGGAGIGVKYLFDEVPPETDPLGPDNKLVIACGPFTGTTIPCASRMAVVSKSPLTGGLGLALAGGHFPVELRKCGYIAIIVEGRAAQPVYVAISDEGVRFRDGARVWGTLTSDCQQIIKDELKNQAYRVACIGPAGEKQSRLACIINERRAAGRKGFGAVLGAKNLKAIAVLGTGSVSIADDQTYRRGLKRMRHWMRESPVLYPFFSKYGTSQGIDGHSAKGIFPARNFTATGDFAPVQTLGGEARRAQTIGRSFCAGCPVGCGQLMLARTGRYAGILAEGPEYETVYALGGQTGVDDLDSVIAADRLSDEFGLDTMSAGVTIGFAMELFERGLLTSEDVDGLDLSFGNHESMLELLRKMGLREGFGDTLADGVRMAAARLGNDTEQYAMHVKGLELPGYDPRGAKAHGLNYATAFTGADHNRGYAIQEIFGIPVPFAVDRFSREKKGELTKWNQDLRTATCDCPTMCAFIFDTALASHALENTSALLRGVTGLDLSPDEVQRVGERINNLGRIFNLRAGFTRADDTLPVRVLTEPIAAGASKGHAVGVEDFSVMLDEYYLARGWDVATGAPSAEKLVELGLEEAIE